MLTFPLEDSTASPAEPILAPIPPTGSNCCDRYSTDATETEENVKASADHVAKRLAQCRWKHTVVDYYWCFRGPGMDYRSQEDLEAAMSARAAGGISPLPSQESAEVAPNSGAQPFLDQGLRNLEQARYEQAIAAFRQALELDPALLVARYDLGVAYFSLQKLPEARQAFEAVLRQDPKHHFARYFLARVDLAEGHYEAAIRGFRALPQVNPIADEVYYRGYAYFRNGETQQAIWTLKRLSVSKPRDYRVHLLLARAFEKAGRKSEAGREYALSEKLRADYQEKAREMVECQGSLQKQDLQNALERCRQLLDGDDPLKLTSLGTLLAQWQLYNQAVLPLEKAARLDPENYEAWFNLGLTYFKMKKYREAKQPLETAVALRPESYDAVAMLGSVLFAQGDDFKAAEQLRHAHQLRPTDERVKTLLFEELRMIAQHLFAENEFNKSIAFFEEALALKPEVPKLHLQLAKAYAAVGDKVRAAQEEKAAGKNP